MDDRDQEVVTVLILYLATGPALLSPLVDGEETPQKEVLTGAQASEVGERNKNKNNQKKDWKQETCKK